MERWTYLWKGKIRHAVAGMCVLALLGSLVFPAELHAADPNEDVRQDGEQDTPASEPQVQKKELSLEYDDRYSLSQLTDDSNEWVIQSIKTEEVSSRQVSRG